MSGAAAREMRKPEDGPFYALADAMSSGVLLASSERLCWASERLAKMAGFESSSDLAEIPLGDLFSDTGDGSPGSTTRAAVPRTQRTKIGR